MNAWYELQRFLIRLWKEGHILDDEYERYMGLLAQLKPVYRDGTVETYSTDDPSHPVEVVMDEAGVTHYKLPPKITGTAAPGCVVEIVGMEYDPNERIPIAGIE